MTIQLTKIAIAILLLATFSAPSLINRYDRLPDIGTSASGAVSIGQERTMSDFYVPQRPFNLWSAADAIHQLTS